MTTQMAKLIRNGLFKEVLTLYSQFHSASISGMFLPKKPAFPYLLKACAGLKALSEAQMLHAHIIKSGFQFNIHTATALASVYMKLGLVDNATYVFDEIPQPTIALYNAVISGFSQNGFSDKALKMFRLANDRNVRPDSVTIASGLSACFDVEHGVQLHSWAVKIGVEIDIYVATSLVTMYLSSRALASAERLFLMIHNKSVVFYNAYLSGMQQNGANCQVLSTFNEMRSSSGERPNSVTLLSVTSACANLKHLRYGRQVHALVTKGKQMFDTKIGTALVDMYSKCGSWDSAYEVFKELGSRRNLITWNSMIAGMMLNNQCESAVDLFAQLEGEEFLPDSATWNSMINGCSCLGKPEEAFIFFRKMISFGVVPSPKCITSLLTACSALCALRYGQEIHACVLRTGIDSDNFIATAMIDMYMKCGETTFAQDIFNHYEIRPTDPAFWNAMISGYGRNGRGEDASKLFYQMLEERVQPNLATFNCMLSMCSHTGQVDLGWQIFQLMIVDYSLQPTSEQLSIIIDMLGRSGLLKEAQDLLQEVTEPSSSVFASLLAASKQYIDSEVAEEMAKKLSALQPDNPIPFLILSNIYAGLEKWNDVERIRTFVGETKLRKVPGHSKVGVT
ncbi:OLC1v1028025C1 [Oldenlandia corymbosa var. corymbosa]|uniref:OLC1v1028025C1 n=1 Tax=Oldenlandia corymbosa var. corymbosa TaxID=529605 RepID=A0AAV1CBI5_OLDCO|nr:OLC1v1028025C1 [Oldenlandia corymbosa var. corymbosa]